MLMGKLVNLTALIGNGLFINFVKATTLGKGRGEINKTCAAIRPPVLKSQARIGIEAQGAAGENR
jgi:hypothetical protein